MAEKWSFIREIGLDNGQTLKINQLYVGDVGCVVWDAALVLGKFLENENYFPPSSLSGKSVIELGSGTGAVGLIACALGYARGVKDQLFLLKMLNI